MGKVLCFILGFVCGCASLLLVGIYQQSLSNDGLLPGMTLFVEKGSCISKKNFHIFQALGTTGLAHEKGTSSFSDMYDGITVLFMNQEDKPYYDDQKIVIPKNKCARQVGIYHYETKAHDYKTVPVVIVD